MSRLTHDRLRAESRCKEAVKAMPVAQKEQIIAHLRNLAGDEVSKLKLHSDPVKIHRSQGALQTFDLVLGILLNHQES